MPKTLHNPSAFLLTLPARNFTKRETKHWITEERGVNATLLVCNLKLLHVIFVFENLEPLTYHDIPIVLSLLSELKMCSD